MRYLKPLLIALVLGCIASTASAQEKKKWKDAKIKKVHVGFQTFQDDERTVYKAGLWTPIYIEIDGGTDGITRRPKDDPPYIEIETPDSEDVGTKVFIPIVGVDPEKTQTFMTYIKTGHLTHNRSETKVTMHANGREYRHGGGFDMNFTVNINAHVYLTLGSKMADLNNAVRVMDQQPGVRPEDRDPFDRVNALRHVVYELKADRLPDSWFGYEGVDMIFLTTENDKFLMDLAGRGEKIAALSQWVRRGGRLIVPISYANQDKVANLLEDKNWQVTIPVVPPRIAENTTVDSMSGFEIWGGVQAQPYKAKNNTPVRLATFDEAKVPLGAWDVQAYNENNDKNKRPVVMRVRYGLGQIVYVAVSLEDQAFFGWAGKQKFLQGMVTQLSPTAPTQLQDRDFRGMQVANDISTELVNTLDNFDVKVIPFGYVALFIVLYILVVGPLDFFLLKYVFKRLEWTWITFPAVVLGVSVIAYFAAYALKGRDLKINKVDIVDFDLRTSLDRNTQQPTQAYAYGRSFFTVLSPRIQNYTIGMEPNSEFWGESAGNKVRSVDVLSWMGRPSGGMHDMGRSGGGVFFRKPYEFTEDSAGVRGVPIPVWTTKAFTASWEQRLAKPPFEAALLYHQKPVGGKDIKISGKLENHLGVDLVDAWILYQDRCYQIEGGLKSVKKGAQAKEISIADPHEDIKQWVTQVVGKAEEQEPRAWTSNPATQVKQILFLGRGADINNPTRNHLLRPLGLGWRVEGEQREAGKTDRRVREAILYARVKFNSGDAESMTRDTNNPVPTKIWMQGIPRPDDPNSRRPDLVGQMNQDTYVRVLLALRPADE